MPTYEYACRSCGEHLEVVQSFYDDPLTSCPGCGGELRKVFGSIGIVFKGSGFYKTDSRASGSASVSGASKESTERSSGDAAPAATNSSTAPDTPASKDTGTKASDAGSAA